MNKDQRSKEASKSSDELLGAMRLMSASSLTLNRVLQALSGQLKQPDLSGTFIVNGTLDNLNLSTAVLVSSYSWGTASNFTCENCDFSSADLSKFHLSAPCNVKGAVFKGVSAEAMKGLNLASCQY